MSLYESILNVDSARTMYTLLSLILTILIALSLWEGRRVTKRGVVGPLLGALFAVVLSRVVYLANEEALASFGSIHFVVFSILNLIGYQCVALSLLRLGSKENPLDSGTSKRGGSQSAPESLNLNRHLVYTALFGAFIYLLRSPGNSISEFIIGLLNAMIIAATLRVLVYLILEIKRGPELFRPTVFVSISLLTFSWLLLEASPMMSDTAASTALGISRMLDVAALFLVIIGLSSNYIRLGLYFRMKAVESRREIDTTKAELNKLNKIANNIYEDSSDLMKKQKEQTLIYMKKVESLEKILEIGNTIQRRHRLEDLLQMIVELVRDNLGFKTVTLRLFNEKSQSFETSAYVGLSAEVRDTVVNYRIPLSEYKKMIEPRFRISKSYFIKNSSPWYGEDLGDETMLVENTWGEVDMLIVPLMGEESTIGYLSVENPKNPKIAVADVIENLESVATLAVIAIRNARFFKELEAKNEKLQVYADKLSGLNKLKSNFVATISHEFRTPLTSIKAYCDTLLKNADDVDRELLKQFLIVIDEESERLMSLIEDILDFSQMESGAMKFERALCNMNDIVAVASRELERNFEAKSLTLHRQVPAEPVLVQAESDLMKQLMINLLHNASKFTREGGNVWLRVEDETVSVRIVVEDEGIGIPADQLDKIFEQFYQVDNSSTRKYGGSGLGLAICKNIVEWHDGRIWVENVRDVGSRFVAVIPKKHVVVKTHSFVADSTVRRYEIERYLELLIDNIAEFVSVRKASIMLLDEERKELRIECAIGLDEDVVEKARVALGEGISGKVALEGRTMLVKNIEKDARVRRSNNELAYGSKSFLSVPIRYEDSVLGVVNVASPIAKHSLDEDDSRLLEVLVERLGVAIHKLQAFTEAAQSYEQIRATFKAILDTKRNTDLSEDDLITRLAVQTAMKLGLREDAISRLRYVMNVYDLGLASVGYHIIKNPNQLTNKDREEIEKHAELGTEMLSVIEADQKVGDVVRYHHENFDGSGYPDGRKGEAIPIESRIVRVADSMRALISKRPYQRQYKFDEAIEVVRHRSGTFFDPKVVDALLEVIGEMRTAQNQDLSEKSDEAVEERK